MSIHVKTRASKTSPCPICRGDHSCCETVDGRIFCRRRRQGEHVPGYRCVGDTRCGGWGMWREEGDTRGRCRGHSSGAAEPKRPTPKPQPEPKRPDVDAWYARLRQKYGGGHEVHRLAFRLGVHPDALDRLGVLHLPADDREEESWAFPERDAVGDIIGISKRYADASKKSAPGSRRGLTYVEDWRSGSGPIYIVEGGSDVAAGLTLGVRVIGRPSNVGGVEPLADLLEEPAQAGEEIIVLGENDQKPNGLWPGRDGAQLVAQQLAQRLGVKIRWALPPDGAKDLRSWLNAQRADVLDVDAMRELAVHFAHVVEQQTVTVKVDDDEPDYSSLVADGHDPYQQFRHKAGKSKAAGAGRDEQDIRVLAGREEAKRLNADIRDLVEAAAALKEDLKKWEKESRHLPYGPKCQVHMPVIRKGVPDGGRMRNLLDSCVYRCDCNVGCPNCSANNQRRECRRLCRAIQSVPACEQMWVWSGPEQLLHRLARSVRDQKGKRYFVLQPNAQAFAVSSVPLEGGIEVSRAEALRRGVAAIKTRRENCSEPYLWSHGWGSEGPGPAFECEQVIPLGPVQISQGELRRQFAEKFQIESENITDGRLNDRMVSRCFLDLPAQWLQDIEDIGIVKAKKNLRAWLDIETVPESIATPPFDDVTVSAGASRRRRKQGEFDLDDDDTG